MNRLSIAPQPQMRTRITVPAQRSAPPRRATISPIKARKPVTEYGVTLQVNDDGKLASDLIYNRFQIMESVIGDTFYLVDHTLPDLIVKDRAGDMRRFYAIEEAADFIASTLHLRHL